MKSESPSIPQLTSSSKAPPPILPQTTLWRPNVQTPEATGDVFFQQGPTSYTSANASRRPNIQTPEATRDVSHSDYCILPGERAAFPWRHVFTAACKNPEGAIQFISVYIQQEDIPKVQQMEAILNLGLSLKSLRWACWDKLIALMGDSSINSKAHSGKLPAVHLWCNSKVWNAVTQNPNQKSCRKFKEIAIFAGRGDWGGQTKSLKKYLVFLLIFWEIHICIRCSLVIFTLRSTIYSSCWITATTHSLSYLCLFVFITHRVLSVLPISTWTWAIPRSTRTTFRRQTAPALWWNSSPLYDGAPPRSMMELLPAPQWNSSPLHDGTPPCSTKECWLAWVCAGTPATISWWEQYPVRFRRHCFALASRTSGSDSLLVLWAWRGSNVIQMVHS